MPTAIANTWNMLYARQQLGALGAQERLMMLLQAGIESFDMPYGALYRVRSRRSNIIIETAPRLELVQHRLFMRMCVQTLRHAAPIFEPHVAALTPNAPAGTFLAIPVSLQSETLLVFADSVSRMKPVVMPDLAYLHLLALSTGRWLASLYGSR